MSKESQMRVTGTGAGDQCCPFDLNASCMGPECMAWVFREEVPEGSENLFDFEGRCGLAGPLR
jgi:hypothetical protein